MSRFYPDGYVFDDAVSVDSGGVHTNVGGGVSDTKKVKVKRRQPEFEFHCCVGDYLRTALAADVRWFHVPNGEHRTQATGERLKRMGVMPGVPDIIILHAGRTLWLELKSNKGKLSPTQEDWREFLCNNGFAFYCCNTLDQVQASLKANGIPLRGVLQ
jgi:hypothetical protein